MTRQDALSFQFAISACEGGRKPFAIPGLLDDLETLSTTRLRKAVLFLNTLARQV